jgi:nucleotide-binding universal stress UspA family protein
MHFLISPEKVVDTLKKCIQWKNDQSIKSAKLPLNIFIDFVKLRIVPKNDSALNAFQAFFKNPDNLKAEGKLEAWIEIGIDIGLEQIPNLEKDLQERYEKVEQFYKLILKEQKAKEEKLLPKIEEKAEVPVVEQIIENEIEDTVPDSQKPIIVPWDFSEVSQYALDHAILYAKTIGGKILLLHLTNDQKEIVSAKSNMEKIASETRKKSGILPEIMVQKGNIFKTITQVANDNQAKFAIMGTHGIKGMQKFTGSFALKVIAGTNTPFIVVQEPPQKETIKSVQFPIDISKENKQKLKQAKLLAHFYKPKFYLTLPENVANDHAQHHLKSNLNYVIGYFRQYDIDYEIVHIAGTESFSDSTLKFAHENKPDLILILTTKNINFQDYVLGAEEQKIIANPSRIPVMCVNPREVKYGGPGVTSITY